MDSSEIDNNRPDDQPSADGFAECVDARGLRCPMPLLQAKQALNRVAPGCLIQVLATDSGAARDFPAFARLSGHELVRQTQDNAILEFVIKKREEND